MRFVLLQGRITTLMDLLSLQAVVVVVAAVAIDGYTVLLRRYYCFAVVDHDGD